MEKTEHLAKRFREVILNGTWIANTNYKDQLESIDWKVAILKWGSLNSISILAQHIHYYINGIKNVLHGGDLEIKDQYSFDFSAIESEDEWKIFLTRFWTDAGDLADLIAQLPDEILQQSFVKEKYGTYQRNINGMIEHSYYHLGQIVIIKKLLMENPYILQAKL